METGHPERDTVAVRDGQELGAGARRRMQTAPNQRRQGVQVMSFDRDQLPGTEQGGRVDLKEAGTETQHEHRITTSFCPFSHPHPSIHSPSRHVINIWH